MAGGVTLKINGVEYRAENAAEESTLQEILDAMLNQTSATRQQTSTISKNQQNQTINTQQSNQALGNFNQAARKTENTLEDLERSADDAGGSLLSTAKSVASGFNSAVKGMFSTLEKGEVDPRAMLTSMSDALSTGLSGIGGVIGGAIGSIIPGVGTAMGAAFGKGAGDVAGGALTTLTAGIGAAIGVMDGLAVQIQDLGNQGVIFGEGITSATNNILESGMTLNQFSKLVQESGDSLRVLGGGATQGSKRFLDFYKNVRSSRDQFINLGFAIEDMPGLMADFTAGIQRAGGDLEKLTPEELRQGTLDYAKNVRMLADLTGDDVKAQKEKKRQIAEEAQLQKTIRDLQKSGVTDAEERVRTTISLMQEMGFSYEDSVKYINRGVMTGSGALMGAQDGFSQTLTELRRKLYETDPSVPIDQFGTSMVESMKAYAPAVQNSLDFLDDIAASGADVAIAATEGIGKANKFYEGLDKYDPVKAQKERDDAAKNAAKDQVNEGIVALNEAKQQIAESFQSVSVALTGGAETLITPAVNTLANAITAGANQIIEFTKNPEDYYKNLMDTGSGTQAEKEAGLVKSSAVKAIDLLSEYTTALIPGVNSFGESYYRIEEWLSNMFEDNQPSTVEEKSTWDSFWDFMTQSYEQPTQTTTSTSDQTPKVPMPEAENQTVPTKAYGDIVNPTPGGRIVRVAEAGQPEIIAPASRGPGGKLGLEVSGAMLDNSRLLQSLVKVNEDQAAMISGLNSQMANMNSNFEKLVYEQRQANRLAV